MNDQLVVSGEPVVEITGEKCAKEFYSKDGLQKHMADVHDQFEEDAEAELYFDMEEEIYTDCAYIPCLCQLRITNQNTEKTR